MPFTLSPGDFAGETPVCLPEHWQTAGCSHHLVFNHGFEWCWHILGSSREGEGPMHSSTPAVTAGWFLHSQPQHGLVCEDTLLMVEPKRRVCTLFRRPEYNLTGSSGSCHKTTYVRPCRRCRDSHKALLSPFASQKAACLLSHAINRNSSRAICRGILSHPLPPKQSYLGASH